MAGGPLLPSSMYLGGASGNLSATFEIPNTNTNGAGAFEKIGVVQSLAADAPAVLQFNLPHGTLPTGTAKLRLLAAANATSGNAKITVADAGTAPGSNIGATTLTTDASASTVTWTTADIQVETKVTLTGAGITAGNILTVLLTFNTASWTLAAPSYWQASLIWE